MINSYLLCTYFTPFIIPYIYHIYFVHYKYCSNYSPIAPPTLSPENWDLFEARRATSTTLRRNTKTRTGALKNPWGARKNRSRIDYPLVI